MRPEGRSSDGVSSTGIGRRFAVVLNEASGFSLDGRSGATEAIQAAFTHHGLIPVFISSSIGDLP